MLDNTEYLMASKIDNLLRLQIRMETRLPKIGQADRQPTPIKLPGRRHFADQFSESFYPADQLNKTLGRRHFGRLQHNENEECIHRERKHYMPTVHEQQQLSDKTNIRGWNYSTRTRSPLLKCKASTQPQE